MKKVIFCLLIPSLITISSFSCKKNGAVTINVKKQSTGKPIEIADSVVVLVKNTENIYKFYMGCTSLIGVVVFSDVANAKYEITSQLWDGSKALTDKKNIQIKNGQSVTVDLLLQ